MLFLINPLLPISFRCQKLVEQKAAPRTEVIMWDRLESPSVNILFTAKVLSPNPLSWDMDCLLTLWPLLIPRSLGKGCCTFGFLIFIIVERNFLYNSLYILTERSLKHLCSIRAWVPMSVCLFPSLSLSPSLWLSLFHFLIVDSGPPGVRTILFNVFLNSVCCYFAENFCTDAHQGYWPVILFSCSIHV